MRVFKNAVFERFARKQDISDMILWKAVERVEKGLIECGQFREVRKDGQEV